MNGAPNATTTRAPARRRPLKVAEIFGPTYQGEGTSTGRLAAFVRLSRCNLTCSWCDTPYTWDHARFDLNAESTPMAPAQVWERLQHIRAGLVVVTGGEPLLQQSGLATLATAISESGRRVEVETNGTIPPRDDFAAHVDQFNVGVKLANSTVAPERRIRPDAVEHLAASGKAVWKFVVTEAGDLEEIAALEQRFTLSPIWVMPEGTTAHEVIERMRHLAEPVLQRGWNLTPRLHTLLWGDVRGR